MWNEESSNLVVSFQLCPAIQADERCPRTQKTLDQNPEARSEKQKQKQREVNAKRETRTRTLTS